MHKPEQAPVLITGGTGFLGQHLAACLIFRGMKVRILARSRAKAEPLARLGAEICLGDITQFETVHQAVKGCQVVIHLAGIVASHLPFKDFEQVNQNGTRNVVEAAQQAGVERFVHVSSVVVYGLKGEGINEEAPHLASGDAYTDTKLNAEKLVHSWISERGLPGVIIQPAPVYGPQDEAWTAGPIRRMQTGGFVLIDRGRGRLHPIYIDDVVEGIFLALMKGKDGEAYILSGPEVTSLKDFFGCYARMLGRSPDFLSIPGQLALGAASAAEWLGRLQHKKPLLTRQEVLFASIDASYSGEKARRELGFNPCTDLERGMTEVEAWAKGTRLIQP
jgi:nucleoside-diphosphate-sugar epimerase